MSTSTGFRFPRSLFGALLVLTLAFLAYSTAKAQLPREGSDLLDQARRLREVATQKLEADVRDAIRRAQAAEPAQGAAILKQMLTTVENDTTCQPERRGTMKRLLVTQLRQVEGAARSPIPVPRNETTQVPASPAPAPGRRGYDPGRAQQEQEDVARSLANVRKLQIEGKFPEAARLASDIARQYPENPSAQMAARTSQAADRVVDNRTARTDNQRRYNGVLAGIDRSSLPIVDDAEFPPDWKEKSARRAKQMVQMSDKERSMVKALNTSVSVSFKGSRFEDAIHELERITGQVILLDKQSLEEAQITYDTPVNLQLTNVAFRTSLRKLLADHGLTYVIKDQTLQVMTTAKAREQMTVRTYYVGDLLFVPGFTLPPALTQLQMAQTLSQLVDLIQRTVDPQSWQMNNGSGTIAFDPITMSLIIKQSAEMHFLIGGGLGGAK